MSEGASFSTSPEPLNLVPEQSSGPQNSFRALDAQIEAHQERDKNRSVLGWTVSQFYRSDENSLESMQRLREQAAQAQASGDTATAARLQGQIAQHIKTDESATNFQDELSHYIGGGLKTAALFLGPGLLSRKKLPIIGMAATVGLYGADQAKVGDFNFDNAGAFTADFLEGGVKGGALRSVFGLLGQKMHASNIAVKGMAMGTSSRLIETGLSRNNWMTDGSLDLGKGGGALWNTVAQPKALLADAALFTVAHGMAKGANAMTNGALSRPFYQNVLTSGTFGLSNGTYAEIMRQQETNPNASLNWGEVVKRGLLQGGVDAIAGAPGGLAMDPGFRRAPVQTMRADARAIGENFGQMKDTVLDTTSGFLNRTTSSLSDWMTPGGGPQFAYATATAGGGRYGGDFTAPRPMSERLGATYMTAQNTGADVTGTGGQRVLSDASGVQRAPGEVVAPPAEVVVAPNRVATNSSFREQPGAKPGEQVGMAEPGQPIRVTPEALGEPTARVAKVVPSNPKETSFESLLSKATGEGATPQDMVNLYGFMKETPIIDGYASKVYLERFEHDGVRTALEGFYKPERFTFEPSLEDKGTRAAYEKLRIWAKNPLVRSAPDLMAKNLQKYLAAEDAKGIDLRPTLRQVGATTQDPLIRQTLTRVLGVDFNALAAFHDPSRSMTVEPTQLDVAIQDAQYLQGVRMGVIRPPVVPQVEVPTGEQLPGDAADLAQSFMGRDAAARTAEATQPVVDPRQAELTAKANAIRDGQVTAAVGDLTAPEAPKRASALSRLGGLLDHPTAPQWFEAWRTEAAQNLYRGTILNAPEVTALPPETLRSFLAAGGGNAAKLEARLDLLTATVNTFKTSPEATRALVEHGITNPWAVQNILTTVNGRNGQQYADFLSRGLQEGKPLSELGQIHFTFQEAPHVAQKLVEMEASGELDVASLMNRMGHPKFGQELKQQVIKRVERGDSAAKIEGERIFGEMLAENTFRNSPDTLVRLLELADANPAALQEVVSPPRPPQPPREKGPRTGPPPRPERMDPRIQTAYLELVKLITPQAQSIEQIKQITDLAKAGNGNAAYSAAKALVPAEQLPTLDALVGAVATKNANLVPPEIAARGREEAMRAKAEREGRPLTNTGERPTTTGERPIDTTTNTGGRPPGTAEEIPGAGEQRPGTGEQRPGEELPGTGQRPPNEQPQPVPGEVTRDQTHTGEDFVVTGDNPHTKEVEPIRVELTRPGEEVRTNTGEEARTPAEEVRTNTGEDLTAKVEPAPVDPAVARASLVQKIGAKFPEAPQFAERLADMAGDQPQLVDQILYRAGHPRFGEAYRRVVAEQVNSPEQLARFASPTALAEARLLDAFRETPQVGNALAEMAARGEINPDNILNRMNNPYFGRTFTEVLTNRLQDTTNPPTAAEVAGDAIYLRALAKRSIGFWPEIADRIVELGGGNARAMQDVLNSPRNNRELERPYKDMVKQLTPQAQSIEQLAEVANAVKRGQADEALRLAETIRPQNDAQWGYTQDLIRGLAANDAAGLATVQQNRPRFPRTDGGGQRDGGQRRDGGGQRRDGGGQRRDGQRPPAVTEGDPVVPVVDPTESGGEQPTSFRQRQNRYADRPRTDIAALEAQAAAEAELASKQAEWQRRKGRNRGDDDYGGGGGRPGGRNRGGANRNRWEDYADEE